VRTSDRARGFFIRPMGLHPKAASADGAPSLVSVKSLDFARFRAPLLRPAGHRRRAVWVRGSGAPRRRPCLGASAKAVGKDAARRRPKADEIEHRAARTGDADTAPCPVP
jgi:hypothetical protein